MTDVYRRLGLAAFVVATLVLLAPASMPMVQAAEPVVATIDEPDQTAPATTVSETTEPETTEPGIVETAPTEPDDDADVGTVTIVGVIAFSLLLVVASWWMVRRRDDDGAPHPRPPGPEEPLPGRDLL